MYGFGTGEWKLNGLMQTGRHVMLILKLTMVVDWDMRVRGG